MTNDARRRGNGSLLDVRAGAAALALLLAAPLSATVWSRANETIRLPKAGHAELADLSYAGRDWGVAITALDVRQAPTPPGVRGETATVWTFHYTNTDHEPHYVLLNVRCLDGQRKERATFKAALTLLADKPGGGKTDVSVRVRDSDWQASSTVKLVADFVSGPEG